MKSDKNMRGDKVKKLSDLFEKYKKTLIAPEATVVNAFVEVVDDLLGIKIPKERINYKPGSKTLSLVSGAVLRTEIKMHEKEIMNHLKGRLGEKNAPRVIL